MTYFFIYKLNVDTTLRIISFTTNYIWVANRKYLINQAMKVINQAMELLIK